MLILFADAGLTKARRLGIRLRTSCKVFLHLVWTETLVTYRVNVDSHWALFDVCAQSICPDLSDIRTFNASRPTRCVMLSSQLPPAKIRGHSRTQKFQKVF